MIVFGLLAVTGAALAQELAPTDWTDATAIFSTLEESEQPSLVADPSGIVHAVWRERSGNRDVLVYTQSEGDRWRNPIDILLTPGGRDVNTPRLVIDAVNQLHVVWTAGGELFYSNAFAADGYSSANWLPPRSVLPLRGSFSDPSLTVAGDGTLHAVLTLSGVGKGIYHTQSVADDVQWRSPVPIQLLAAQSTAARPQIVYGLDGNLHAVWVETLENGSAESSNRIRYARSQDDGATWEAAQTLAEGNVDWPQVETRTVREVHVVWSGAGDDFGVYHRVSRNNGVAWDETWSVVEIGGFHGEAALIRDGSNNLNRVHIGTAAQAPDTQLVHHLLWRNDRWSINEVTAPMSVRGSRVAGNVSAAVQLGDTLVIAYERPISIEGSQQQSDIYTQRQRLENTAALAPRAVVPVVIEPTPAAETATAPTAVAAIETTPIPDFSGPVERPGNRWQPIVLAVGASGLFLVVVVTVIIIGRSRRY